MTIRRMFPILVLTLVTSFLTGCSSDNVAPPGPDGSAPERPDTGVLENRPPDASETSRLLAQLAQARATWDAAKASCATYHYVNQHQHLPFGGCSKTAVEISQDQPTRRRSYSGAGSCSGDSDVLWDETGTDVGSHSGAAAAWTVEQLFADCQQNLSASDPGANTLTLVVGSMGVPSTCGHTPKNCADDCFVGFSLGSFACGPLPPEPARDGGTGDVPDSRTGASQ